jgi:Holliday junction resolvasome RuvABC endonuclease subunit
MHNLMAIDQSLTGTGIVIWTEKDGYVFKILSTARTKGTKCPTIDYTRRILWLKEEIKTLCEEYHIQKGIIEGMAFGSKGRTVFDLGGLAHASRMALIEAGVDFIVIPPKTAKRYFTGSGNSDKMAMIAEAHKRQVKIPYMKKYSKDLTDFDDNIVDAFAFSCFLRDFHSDTLPADFIDKVEYSTDE